MNIFGNMQMYNLQITKLFINENPTIILALLLPDYFEKHLTKCLYLSIDNETQKPILSACGSTPFIKNKEDLLIKSNILK